MTNAESTTKSILGSRSETPQNGTTKCTPGRTKNWFKPRKCKRCKHRCKLRVRKGGDLIYCPRYEFVGREVYHAQKETD